MTKRRASTIFNVVAFVLRTGLTLLAAGILLTQAMGYAIDFDDLTITKIGLLVLHVSPTDASVMVSDGVLQSDRSNLVAQLPSGTYSVEVSKDTYRTWRQTVTIAPGLSYAYPAVTLFLDVPELRSRRLATIDELLSPLVDDRLIVRGSELWRTLRGEQQLVTRFSQPIRSAILLDSAHVVVQIGRIIHVFDIDGSNDQSLVVLDDDRPRRLLAIDTETIGLLDLDTVSGYRVR